MSTWHSAHFIFIAPHLTLYSLEQIVFLAILQFSQKDFPIPQLRVCIWLDLLKTLGPPPAPMITLD